MKTSRRTSSTRKFYVVSHRGEHDDEFFNFSSLSMLGTNQHEAWVKYLKLVGGERHTWNKRGYIAVPVMVTVEVDTDVSSS